MSRFGAQRAPLQCCFAPNPSADTADAVERILGPIIVNIMLYHLFLDRSGIALGICISITTLFLLWVHRYKFPAIFRP